MGFVQKSSLNAAIKIIFFHLALCNAGTALAAKSSLKEAAKPESYLKGPSYFKEGQPGCLSLVQGRAISDKDAKVLPAECQKFRKSFLRALYRFSEGSKKLDAELKPAIQNAKGFVPPYHALLFAVITGSKTLLPAIEQRLKIEQKKNLRFRYADAAVQRLTTGECDQKTLDEPMYREICSATDSAFNKIASLNGAKTK